MIDFLLNLPPGWLALAGTFIGTIGLKVMEKWLNGNKERREDDNARRDEIKELRERLDKVEAEVDDWRAKYWTAQEEVTSLKRALIVAGIPVPGQPSNPPPQTAN